jgi:parvulin-like peptidyl-prolyl isomerase
MGKNKQANNQDSGSGGGAPIKGGKISASHILVKKLSLAQQICDDLQAGKDFGALAKQYSDCTSKNKSGNLGSFDKQKMVPEFWTACTKLRINQISEPVKTQFGYHIIKRTG